jgi:hypothetical protein
VSSSLANGNGNVDLWGRWGLIVIVIVIVVKGAARQVECKCPLMNAGPLWCLSFALAEVTLLERWCQKDMSQRYYFLFKKKDASAGNAVS